MSAEEVDTYLKGATDSQLHTLQEIRKTLLELIPGGEEVISYGMPAIKLDGKVIAGYAFFKNHLSYFPHSSIVISRLEKELENYQTSKGGFRFANDHVLPKDLLRKLVAEKQKLIKELN